MWGHCWTGSQPKVSRRQPGGLWPQMCGRKAAQHRPDTSCRVPGPAAQAGQLLSGTVLCRTPWTGRGDESSYSWRGTTAAWQHGDWWGGGGNPAEQTCRSVKSQLFQVTFGASHTQMSHTCWCMFSYDAKAWGFLNKYSLPPAPFTEDNSAVVAQTKLTLTAAV